MSYKSTLLEALCIRREVYAADSKDERFRYMAEGIEAAEVIARCIPEEEVVRGKWLPNVPPRDLRPRCSVCDELFPTMSNYCPHCGARMEASDV